MRGCEEPVHWGKHVMGYELTRDGVRAMSPDGSKSVEGLMLVGWKGLRSGTPKQVSSGRLVVYDTEVRGIQGQASTTA